MQHKEVDVRKRNMNERQQIIAKIFEVVDEDNEKLVGIFQLKLVFDYLAKVLLRLDLWRI